MTNDDFEKSFQRALAAAARRVEKGSKLQADVWAKEMHRTGKEPRPGVKSYLHQHLPAEDFTGKPKLITTISYKPTGATGTYKIKVYRHNRTFDPYEYKVEQPGGGYFFTSLKFDERAKTVDHAKASVRSTIASNAKAAREAAKSPARKAHERKMVDVNFFRKHATKDYAEAKKLAEAEKYAEEHEWKFEWKYDVDPDMSGIEDAKEVLVAILRDKDGHVLQSLGGIADPSQSYRRVVEAEMALEAMP
jgi:hypothetical protein